MRLTPSSPSVWKTTILPGLLFGILLALVHIGLIFFLPPQLESPFIILFILFLYLVIPALIAFVVTHRTQQSAIGYRVGMLSGVSCSVLLLLVMVIIIIFQIANAEATTTAIGRLGAGAYLQAAFIAGFILALFLNGMGALLAMLGALLGSRRGRSQAY